MTSLVESALTLTSDGIEAKLTECIRKDMQLCQTKFRVLNRLQRRSLRYFYIVEKNTECPGELRESQFRYIRESIIHLPPNDETLLRLTRAFEAQADDFRFTTPEIKFCEQDRKVIIYSVKPLR